MNESSLFIEGDWIKGDGGLVTSLNPVDNRILWQADGASTSQVDAAVWAARRALPQWRRLSLSQRLEPILRFRELLQQHAEVLAEYIGEETGKPLWESRTEVVAMIGKIGMSIDAYHERCRSYERPSSHWNETLRHRPHGVLAVFGPFNFPAHLPNGHIVPALIAGNTLVFKPSEYCPRIAEQLVGLWHQAGLPDGVLNLIQGAGSEVGQVLAQHPQLDGLLFTGSAATGQALAQQFADQPGKLLALELGGNNPLIIDQVFEVHAAIHDSMVSAFLTAGQRCTCARRLLVPDGAWGDDFINRLGRTLLQLQVGAYDAEPQPFMGAVISNAQALRLLSRQQQLQQQGAASLVTIQHLASDSGLLSPGLIDVTPVPEPGDQEDFGPLLKVIRYEDFDQALMIANDTRFGLSAGLISDSRERYQQFYDQIRAGIVNWNRPITGAAGAMPFGGVKQSGNLRPSAWYAADYCAYPVASMEAEQPQLPVSMMPGLSL
ncbi:succinylglutamate-semialdehyde dehydrogenase [Motiliproteus coralliicola]|uniref:N-succinylglutamate 5-semialdehyde dehydrogenase n=1 Tax=Motiliproteus coralliicola TaxID=2283196 RepID=A0A369WBS5_9GAMM|nr:succinylglutamate-semialdehyde dehydrogenase [Motiliproteus coralliicola]RDE18763.1 succinylglutamate-semialdehyde dehydrogenase [Motiliproteus coralliicola]